LAVGGETIKYSSIADAFTLIEAGSVVVTAMAAAEPYHFWSRAAEFIPKGHGLALKNPPNRTKIFCANPSKPWPLIAEDRMCEFVDVIVMFMTGAMRNLQGRGFVHYIPQHLSQWSRNLLSRPGGVDVFWGTCSLPDSRGYVSLGTSNCYESEVMRAARKVVLEVNPHMPATNGATEVGVDEVDMFIESSEPLPIIEHSSFGEVDKKIADYIVDFVEDGSTLQFGIGSIPNAVGKRLAGKKDLGIHTEMINDAILELYEQGVITGRRKSIWPRKIVGAFAYGSKQLYEFIRENPLVEIHPASVVNDPYRIGRNYKMVSINSAVEIDITGQVCSESLGHRELSGVGGAADTHIGAQRSEGGRGIIAVPSTTKDGMNSKIVATLQPGAKVSISRNDVDTIVTEFGVARLKGLTVPERILAMISIAHPSFRDDLLGQAKTLLYL
jgi:4-hydroxybutyrate CoA-transferase